MLFQRSPEPEPDVMETKARLTEAADMIRHFAVALGHDVPRADDIVAGFAMHLFHSFPWQASKPVEKPAPTVTDEQYVQPMGLAQFIDHLTHGREPDGLLIISNADDEDGSP